MIQYQYDHALVHEYMRKINSVPVLLSIINSPEEVHTLNPSKHPLLSLEPYTNYKYTLKSIYQVSHRTVVGSMLSVTTYIEFYDDLVEFFCSMT